MRIRSELVIGALFGSLCLAGCAADSEASDPSYPSDGAAPSVPTVAASSAAPSDLSSTDPAARAQAQAWLDAAVLPPGAVSATASVATFNSYQGWPCGPVEELKAFWTIPDATVSETANWLRENPAADLITTSLVPMRGDSPATPTAVGFIPAPEAQEGIVYTIMARDDGVVVRAEIAALTEAAVCPTLPDGVLRGAPGQG